MALYTGNIKFTATDTEPTEDKGRLYYDDSEAQLKHYDGTNWGRVSRELTYGVTPGYGPYTVDDYTKLLLHCNGSDDSSTFTDDGDTGHSPAAQNGAVLDTAYKKTGTASGLFDGVDQYVSVPDHADWNFGTGNWTLDFWIRFNSLTGEQHFFGQFPSNFWIIGKRPTTDKLYMQFDMVSNPETVYETTNAPSLSAGTWYHFAFSRNGSSALIFINGVSQAMTTSSGGFSTYDTGDSTDDLRVGYGGDKYMDGWMDEIRVSKGIARWTSSFTVY